MEDGKIDVYKTLVIQVIGTRADNLAWIRMQMLEKCNGDVDKAQAMYEEFNDRSDEIVDMYLKDSIIGGNH